jgi:hypothetical protein
MSDQELRLHAMQMAVEHSKTDGLSEIMLIDLAQQIYEFIKGESK